jgi:hypothetical protein
LLDVVLELELLLLIKELATPPVALKSRNSRGILRLQSMNTF